MSHVQLTIKERGQIELLACLQYSILAIAQELKRAPSTISRELKCTGSDGDYQAERAQEKLWSEAETHRPHLEINPKETNGNLVAGTD